MLNLKIEIRMNKKAIVLQKKQQLLWKKYDIFLKRKITIRKIFFPLYKNIFYDKSNEYSFSMDSLIKQKPQVFKTTQFLSSNNVIEMDFIWEFTTNKYITIFQIYNIYDDLWDTRIYNNYYRNTIPLL